MLIIGLTGSISTGKSTISRILSSAPYNLPIIDADLISHKAIAPNTPGHAAIVDYFSASTPGLLNADGTLDRRALGSRVFGDDPERKRDRAVLNGIVHPLVRKEMYKAIIRHHLTGHWAVVLDVPLLFESGLDLLCGAVLVVSVSSPEVQMRRLLSRDKNLTREEAERRVLSQMAIGDKVEICRGVHNGRGYVIGNDGSVDELKDRVGRVVERLKEGRDGWWRVLLWWVPPVAGVVGAWIVGVNWWRKRRWMAQGERERARSKL